MRPDSAQTASPPGGNPGAAREPLLVCCGLTTLDVVQTVAGVPGPNDKIVADRLDVRFGGPAANAAATAVALGVRTRLVTAIGSGPIADLVRAGLAQAGLEVIDLAAGMSASPPVSTVLVTRATGERAVVSVNAVGMPDLGAAAEAVADDVLSRASALLVDGHHLDAAARIARRAHQGGVTVALDGGSWKPGLGDLLDHVQHAVLSADFRLPEGSSGESVLHEVAERWPVATVARSSGAGPLRWRDPDGAVHELPVAAVPLDEVVDTLGAGDVLHGGLAAALARGADIATALAEGARWATDSVRYAGVGGWLDARRDR